MATITANVDLTNRGDLMEFSGTSAQNVAYARSFWQSLQLHPPLESRLVSMNNNQRLKVAKPPGHNANEPSSRLTQPDTSPRALEYQKHVGHLIRMDESKRLSKFSKARSEDIERLQRLRNLRMKKEQYCMTVRNDEIPSASPRQENRNYSWMASSIEVSEFKPGRTYQIG